MLSGLSANSARIVAVIDANVVSNLRPISGQCSRLPLEKQVAADAPNMTICAANTAASVRYISFAPLNFFSAVGFGLGVGLGEVIESAQRWM